MAPRSRLDDEVIELLSGDPELLAIADALAETQAPRRRVRPLGLAAAAVGLVAVVALALAFWPGGGSPGISGNTAYAAVGGATRVLEVTVVGDATRLSLRLDRRSGEVLAVDRSGTVRARAATLPPETSQLPERLARRLGAGAGPLLSLLLEYPAAAKAGHLDPVASPLRAYRQLHWVSYRSALGYVVEVGLQGRYLAPVVVRGGVPAGVTLVSVSSTN